jgi:hypothetical protein
MDGLLKRIDAGRASGVFGDNATLPHHEDTIAMK